MLLEGACADVHPSCSQQLLLCRCLAGLPTHAACLLLLVVVVVNIVAMMDVVVMHTGNQQEAHAEGLCVWGGETSEGVSARRNATRWCMC